MNYIVFDNNDKGYYDWIENNPNGFVFNYNPSHKNMKSLHVAWCGKIGFKPNSNEKKATSGAVNKLCALKKEGIELWLRRHWNVGISVVNECSCLRREPSNKMGLNKPPMKAKSIEADTAKYELDVTEYINTFMSNRAYLKREERSASFDFCYNYFHEFYKNDRLADVASKSNLHSSCFQLGFYLASWGMYRGSSYLRTRSVVIYEPVIELIARADKRLWSIDIDNYTNSHINIIQSFQQKLRSVLTHNWRAPHIIESKIMLGVFGCVPAFDSLVIKASSIRGFRRQDLLHCENYYNANKSKFDAIKIHTIDMKGNPTDKTYTKAKLLDMVLNTMGDEKDEENQG